MAALDGFSQPPAMEISEPAIQNSMLAVKPRVVKQKKKVTGRWTDEEHARFVEALRLYGKQWRKVEQHVKSRSGA